jgi:TIR domain
MKVFISWSGNQSKAVASALKNWLPKVFLGGIQVWMSDHDIHAGARWGTELAKVLGECNLGIICLTPESLKSHWLTFEAGALSKAMTESRVIPYRFQLSSTDIGPPLSQFEDVFADREGTYKLVRSINDVNNAPLGEDILSPQFEHWWSDLQEQLGAILHIKETQIRSDRELLEEILELIRQTGIRGLNSVLSQLLGIPNVRRIEVAKKEVAGSATHTLALRIMVAKKLAIAQIPPDQIIPSSIFGMPTDVVESG